MEEGFGEALCCILETSLGIGLILVSRGFHETNRLNSERYGSRTMEFNVSSYDRRLSDFRHAVHEILKPLYVQKIYNLRDTYQNTYFNELNPCTRLK